MLAQLPVTPANLLNLREQIVLPYVSTVHLIYLFRQYYYSELLGKGLEQLYALAKKYLIENAWEYF